RCSYRCAITSKSSLAHGVESLFAIRRASSARARQKPSSKSGALATVCPSYHRDDPPSYGTHLGKDVAKRCDGNTNVSAGVTSPLPMPAAGKACLRHLNDCNLSCLGSPPLRPVEPVLSSCRFRVTGHGQVAALRDARQQNR